MTNGDRPDPKPEKVEVVKTTDSRLTWLKEIVTALLGIIIILSTLILMWPQLSKGDTTSLQIANGIFAILGGWGGVVLGYYFGRIPAEKATDSANQAADKARSDAKQANDGRTEALTTAAGALAATDAKAEGVLNKISIVAGGTKAAAPPEIQAILDEVDSLRSTIKKAKDQVDALSKP